MAFWKKIFKSKYTGKEIDAAIAKAGNLPATTSADAGKALVVDEEGKIVTGKAGGNIFEVVFGFNEEGSINCNHTYNEIRAAIADNKTIIARTAYYEDSVCNYFSTIVTGSEIKFQADYFVPTNNEAIGTPSFMNYSHIEIIYTADGITNNYSAWTWNIQDFS